MLDKIFSIQEFEKYKQICILGIRIKCPKIRYNGQFDGLEINNNKIVFKTFNGAYTCNPKYISEELIRQNLNYDMVWITDKKNELYLKDFPENIKMVQSNSLEELEELATAKIWIDNNRKEESVKLGFAKKDGQVYIQTFHGSLGIKKSGVDNPQANYKNYYKYAVKDSEQIDYLVSNGKYTTDFFKRMFFEKGNIVEYGHPRNDIFFKDTTKIREKIYSKYNISADSKILLYAPTYRDDANFNYQDIDYKQLSLALSEKFSGKWSVVLRLHPRIVQNQIAYDNSSGIYDATYYSDIQELLAISDCVITDYSSCIYDFMLTRRPAFIYATDLEDYSSGRGLYYPLETTPFPISQNNGELVDSIKNFDNEEYVKKVDKFLEEKGCVDDGHASERVAELIKNIVTEAQ